MSSVIEERRDLPEARPGDDYVVQMFDPERSMGAELLRGAATLGLTRASAVDFGELCLCCNRQATQRLQLKTGTGLEAYSDPVDVPSCGDCPDHLPRSRGIQFGLGLLFVAPLLLIGLGACDLFIGALGDWGAKTLLGIGLVGLLAAIGVRSLYEVLRKSAAPPGHAPGISVSLGPNRVVLRTSNRTLVERLHSRPDCASVDRMSWISA